MSFMQWKHDQNANNEGGCDGVTQHLASGSVNNAARTLADTMYLVLDTCLFLST